MQILIADDDDVIRSILDATLRSWGHDVVACRNGREAHTRLTSAGGPQVAILDWVMPEMTGPEVCAAMGQRGPDAPPAYLILLTANDDLTDIAAGLNAGANDYIIKPFHPVELQARLQAGLRVVGLQTMLRERVQELQVALSRVKQLHGLLPICCYCHKIRDDSDYWHRVESYLSDHADVKFSHGICPDCFAKHVEADLEELGGERR
jgi:DNA-binding response OmpR family regulator